MVDRFDLNFERFIDTSFRKFDRHNQSINQSINRSINKLVYLYGSSKAGLKGLDKHVQSINIA